MKYPGDPTPRSARDLPADRGYKRVVSDQAAQIRQRVTPVVETRTYWPAP